MDVSLMSADGKLLLGLIECKNDSNEWGNLGDHLLQTLAYTLTALAYS
jgi:hypothetical protein